MILNVFSGGLRRDDLYSVKRSLEDGGLIAVAVDNKYSFLGLSSSLKAINALCEIKGLRKTKKLPLTLFCKDLSQVSVFANISTYAFKFIRQYIPGPYTFILPSSNKLPRVYKGRKEVGIRVGVSPILSQLQDIIDDAFIGASIPILSHHDIAYTYHPELIEEVWATDVSYVIDSGIGINEPSTIISLMSDDFVVLREGQGKI